MVEKLFVPALLSASLCAKLLSVSFKLPSSKLSSLKLCFEKPFSSIKLKLRKVKLLSLPSVKLKLCNNKLQKRSLSRLKLCKVKLSIGKLQLFKVKLSALLLCKLKLGTIKLAKLLSTKFFDKLSLQDSDFGRASWRS